MKSLVSGLRGLLEGGLGAASRDDVHFRNVGAAIVSRAGRPQCMVC